MEQVREVVVEWDKKNGFIIRDNGGPEQSQENRRKVVEERGKGKGLIIRDNSE